MKLRYCLLALLWPAGSLLAQTSLNGVVRNKTNIPLANVSVSLRGSRTHTVTDSAGGFTLGPVSSADTLELWAVGYAPYKKAVLANAPFLIITLTETTAQLDEVVVIGYGTTTQRYATGSVATIAGADIAKQPVLNPLAALEGRVTGLTITQSNGVPGSSFAVQVRGQNSLLQGSEPLFVVDGVPYAPNNNAVNHLSSAAASNSNSGLSPFSSLNPQDIESVTVLKDADATAIYGSRGANGVILITTRKGSRGKTSVSLTGYSGISEVAKPVALLNTEQYLAARREAFRNDGVTPDAMNAPDLYVWDTTRYTDFTKLFTSGTAGTTDVQASLSGGSGNTQFLVSGGYHRETTVFPGDQHDKRGSVNTSLSHTSDNKKLALGLSVLYSSEANSLLSSDLTGETRLSPNFPALIDPSGQLSWREKGISFDNPLAYLQQHYRATTDNLLGNANLSYRLLPHLTLRASGGYHAYRVEEVSTSPAGAQNPMYSPKGYSNFSHNTFRSWIAEPQAEYNNTWGKMKLNVLAGGTMQDTRNDSYSLSAYGYTNEQLLEDPAAASSLSVTGSYQSEYRYGAVFGRATATLHDTYILNLSGRRDGSSRFGPGKQRANFGAIGGAWLFSNEKWMKQGVPFLSFGKLRASYGITGNDQIGDYNYLNTWSPAFYPYNGIAGLYPTRLFNPDYGWETNRKAELGLETGFLKDRVSLIAGYFRNRSSNQLVNTDLPSQTGFASILENLPATVQNTGWELTLTTKNFAEAAFSWTTTLTLTVPRNKLISFPGLETSAYASRYIVGKPLSVTRLYHYEGVDPATGVFRYTDVNKDGELNIQDRTALVNVSPRLFGGILNTLTLKAWTLDFFFQFMKSTGQNDFAATYYRYGPPPGDAVNAPVSVLSRWQQPGDQTGFLRFTTTQGSDAYNSLYYFPSSTGVYTDASFLRLKNAALSYTLPSSLTKKAHLQLLRVFLQGQNLLTITHYRGSDPETQNEYVLPPLRTVTGGIQITF